MDTLDRIEQTKISNTYSENAKRMVDKIYKDIPGLQIEEGDKPDFRLTHKSLGYSFGVEVTEFYFDESSARLRNVGDYLDKLLNKKAYLHRKDEKILKIQNVTIISKNGENKGEAEAIIHYNPDLSTCLAKISQIIKIKNKKYSEYDRDLHHINLIINDAESFLFRIKVKDFYNVFYSSEIVDSILDTSYREIYFITRVENNKRTYFPLKMILFLSRIYAFSLFLGEQYPNKNEFEDEIFYGYLVEFLNCQGFKNIKLLDPKAIKEVIYGNIGFHLQNGNKPILNDYGDFKSPPEAVPIIIKK